MSEVKELIFEEKAREKLATGMQKLSDAVRPTLGPKGRNVGLESAFGSPKITNDSASVVSEIELKDQYENMGAAMAKEVAEKMKQTCGDGTTTAVLLLSELTKLGMKNITAGASPIQLKRELEEAAEALVQLLEKKASPVKSMEDILHIATVSASQDQEVGSMIADAMKKVGIEGVITIEAGKGTESVIQHVEGMEFDRGYLSPYFCTDAAAMKVNLENAALLITDKKISNVQEILPLLQHTASLGMPLLIIAEEIEGDALATLVVNKLRGTLKVAAIKAPGFGDRRKAYLEDIAILTGATVVSEEKGMVLKEAEPHVLGQAGRIEISKDRTRLIDGRGDKKALAARIAQIDAELKKTDSEYEREKLKERQAKLSGGVAVIQVGAPTESAMKQKKQVFEDSLNATYAAHDGGLIPGGGVSLLRASRKITSQSLGAEILKKACEAPFRQLTKNAGYDPTLLVEEVLKQKEDFGFNVLTGQIEDFNKANIIDPLKVTKSALLFASSVAGVCFLSEVLIGDAESDED